MRKLLRGAKKISNFLLGTMSDTLFWRYRHFFDKQWSENYVSENSLSHPHRKLLIEKISAYNPTTVLEVGCASGPNLFLLKRRLPNVKLTGTDISKKAIETGKKWMALHKIRNIELLQGNALDLRNFADKSFDVVFTDAALIYVGKNKISAVIKEILRMAKKSVILVEWSSGSGKSEYVGHWAHDYKTLFAKYAPEAGIKTTKIGADVWPGDWAKYGYIIEAENS